MAITVYWRPGGEIKFRDFSPDHWTILRSVQTLLRDRPGDRYDDGRQEAGAGVGGPADPRGAGGSADLRGTGGVTRPHLDTILEEPGELDMSR